MGRKYMNKALKLSSLIAAGTISAAQKYFKLL